MVILLCERYKFVSYFKVARFEAPLSVILLEVMSK